MTAGRARIAIVEIGTNSTKLLVADALPGGGFESRHFARKTTRIGRGLTAGSELSTDGVRRTATVIDGFRRVIDRLRCTHVFAFSTFALRTAGDPSGARRSIERSLGCRLRVLTGREEARFAYLSASIGHRLRRPDAVLIDVGGGSTELVRVRNRRIQSARSLPLGALHLTERFFRSDPPARDEYAEMKRFIERTILRTCRPVSCLDPSSFDVIASGGSITTLCRMIAEAGAKGRAARRPRDRIRSQDAGAFLERCLSLPLARRKRIPGLEPDRADIIIAGLSVVLALMHRVRKRVAYVNAGGVREGVLTHLIENGLRW